MEKSQARFRHIRYGRDREDCKTSIARRNRLELTSIFSHHNGPEYSFPKDSRPKMTISTNEFDLNTDKPREGTGGTSRDTPD